jgi:hypothetical protein
MSIERRYATQALPIEPPTARPERSGLPSLLAGRGLSKAKRMQLRRLRRLCHVLGALNELPPRAPGAR